MKRTDAERYRRVEMNGSLEEAIMKRLLALFFGLMLTITSGAMLAGCDDNDDLEDAAEEVDDAVEDAGDEIEDATDR
ncbi:MAG: hypothetical protein RL885_10745 [Planctomycetota bacterium]